MCIWNFNPPLICVYEISIHVIQRELEWFEKLFCNFFNIISYNDEHNELQVGIDLWMLLRKFCPLIMNRMTLNAIDIIH